MRWVQRLPIVFAAVGFGLFLPVLRGLSFLEWWWLIPFTCLSAVVVGPLVAEGGTTPRAVVLAALRAWLFMLATVLCGVVFLNVLLAEWHPPQPLLLRPAAALMGNTALTSLAAALLAACLAAVLALRTGPVRAKWVFRGIALAAIVLWRALPEGWTEWVVYFGITRACVLFSVVALLTSGVILVWLRALEAVGER